MRQLGTRIGTRNLLLGAAVVAVALVVGLTIWATSGSSKHDLTSAQYLQLFERAEVGKTTLSVLDQWPKPPYQSFLSGANHCYEWFDKPRNLIDLCFNAKGILIRKVT